MNYLVQFFKMPGHGDDLVDARAIISVLDLHLAVCTSFETLCFTCLYKSLNIVNLEFLHFLSA